ncbi:MAG TPA: carboxypeptidase-like regulatory domain-containing protein, partial [Niastella sp.]|nr:carboxypeptidase-like regulatory domain-containing protein [Niastella sp.]
MPKTATCGQYDVPFLLAQPFPNAPCNRRFKETMIQAKPRGASLLLTATTLKAMRIVIILLFTTSMTVSANTFSQNVTLHAKAQPLKNVLSKVEDQTGFVFFYNRQLLSNSKPVTLSVQHMPLTQFLQTALKDQLLNFRIEGKTVFLFRKAAATTVQETSKPEVPPADSTRNIKGIVTSEAGEPIAGANVVVKGIFRGVAADGKGVFTIRAATGQVLVISAVGYEQMEVRVRTSDVLTIKMAQSITSMKDQVVTGIYQRKKESFTGSSTTFTAKELKVVGNQSPLQ